MQKPKIKEKICLECDKTFKIKDYYYKQKFCSHVCALVYNGRLKKGKKRSEEIKEKIKKGQFKKGETPWNKGKECPQLSKEKHWNWQGGKTSLIRTIRNHGKMKEWRKSVFERDGYTCIECGKTNTELHAHHKMQISAVFKKYEIFTIKDALSCKKLWNIDNGMTLCKDCHYNLGHIKRYTRFGKEPLSCYLSGYINEKKLKQCSGWREKIIEHYENWNDGEGYPIIWLNPMNGELEDIKNEGMESAIPGKSFLYRDFNAVKQADIIVVLLDTFGAKRPLIGTLYEIAWAWQMRKFVIVITKDKYYLNHPFITDTASIIVSSVEELLEKKYLNWFFKGLVTAVV